MDVLPLEDVSDHEEGEIVEDGLEDVSDCSLTPGSPLNPGKSITPAEILNGVCRASSRREKSFIYYGKQKRRISTKKRNSHSTTTKKHSHTRLRRPSIIEIITDSEDEVIDPRYAKQLREALCRETLAASTNNNLKTRLKALIDNPSQSDDEANLDDLRDLALLSTYKPVQSDNCPEHLPEDVESPNSSPLHISDRIDPELHELRLEALKSVILRNHERRKRKAEQVPDNPSSSPTDINKENDQSIINNKKLKLDDSEDIPINEIDLPTNNITDQKTLAECNDSIEEDADILRAILLASMSTRLSNKDKKTPVPLELPRVVVKPLVINLSQDSESDTENVQTNPLKTNLTNNVTEFLKKQRAEVEGNVKKKSSTPPNSSKQQSDIMNKSVMKLLSHSQQLEYRKLQQQLLNAHKKVRTRKNSHKVSANVKKDASHMNGTKRLPLNKTATSLINKNRILVNNRIPKDSIQKKSDPTISHLHSTLDDLQIMKNGRLQMKGKYRSLVPLLNQISQASNERQQHETLIKKLLQDIQIARNNLGKSHQNFTSLVHQLAREKLAIDNKVEQSPVPSAPETVSIETEKKVVPEEKKVVEPIIEIQSPEDVSVCKYNSPLDYRNNMSNPLTTICPYDLLGVCKDPECAYVHYS